MPRIDVGPDHYVLICARQYAVTLRKLQIAASEDEQRGHMKMLHYLMDSGIRERDLECRSRAMRRPADLRDHIDQRKSLRPGRIISTDEIELIRQVNSVPPVATMESLSGQDMVDLADMYEGWAQDGRFEPLEIARLLGWADGLRELAAAIGTDYEPPP
jgi:hypothetical protein